MSFEIAIPFRSARSSSIWYSFPVNGTDWPATSARFASTLTTRSPHRTTVSAVPCERRTTACTRASSSSLWKGFVTVIVGPKAEPFDLVCCGIQARQDQDWRVDVGGAERLKHLVARPVGQVQVEEDDVVGVKLRKLDPFFAAVRHVDGGRCRSQHQLDAVRNRQIVLNHQNVHWAALYRDLLSFPVTSVKKALRAAVQDRQCGPQGLATKWACSSSQGSEQPLCC